MGAHPHRQRLTPLSQKCCLPRHAARAGKKVHTQKSAHWRSEHGVRVHTVDEVCTMGAGSVHRV
eukprot:2134915-Rhodomonas_salina.1